MSRLRPKLRGSVTQNNASQRSRESPSLRKFKFGLRLSLIALAVMSVIIYSIILWQDRWPHRQAERFVDYTLSLTQKAKLSVKDITVEGRRYTSQNDLLAAIGVKTGTPILSFDPDEAYKRITKLPWVEKATVSRLLPDTILVRLTELTPIARWQNGNKTVVIDIAGKEIPIAKPEQFPLLPLVVGTDAPEKTRFLLADLKDFPAIAKELKAARRVSERRWDLFLNHNIQTKNGLLVRLPEKNLDAALAQLEGLIIEQKMLERNIVAIDLRVSGRYVLEKPGEESKE